jgi:uncharacterized protein
MPRRFLRRYLPSPASVRGDRTLSRLFGAWLHNPNLWILNRGSITRAIAVGLFMAFVPVPFQMVLSAGAAILIGCNLPVAVAMVWVTNPLTMGPIFYFSYRVGVVILGDTVKAVEFEISWDWLTHQLSEIWEPFLLGCFVMGIACGTLGALAFNGVWRLHVINSWKARRQRRDNSA